MKSTRTRLACVLAVALLGVACSDDDNYSDADTMTSNSSGDTSGAGATGGDTGGSATGGGGGGETLELLILGNAQLDNACMANVTRDGPFKGRGTLDLLLTPSYTMHPVVFNPYKSSEDQAGLEGNIVLLTEAVVSFETNVPALAGALEPELTIPITGTAFPEQAAPIELKAITDALGRQLDATGLFVTRGTLVDIVVNVRVRGSRSSGEAVQSNTIGFPLEICSGCLLNYPAVTLFPDDDGSQTCDPAMNPGVPVDDDIAPTCIYGQDESVDCRLCRGQIGDPTTADVVCDP